MPVLKGKYSYGIVFLNRRTDGTPSEVIGDSNYYNANDVAYANANAVIPTDADDDYIYIYYSCDAADGKR